MVNFVSFPHARLGPIVMPALKNRIEVSRRFRMYANFIGQGPGACDRCHYRQFVKGFFRIQYSGTGGWFTLQHKLRRVSVVPKPILLMRLNQYGDDGYGYRNWKGQDPQDHYEIRQIDGCEYKGFDAPGMLANVGDRIHMKLDFKGAIQELPPGSTAANGREVVTQYWTEEFRGEIARKEVGRLFPWTNLYDDWLAKKSKKVVLESFD